MTINQLDIDTFLSDTDKQSQSEASIYAGMSPVITHIRDFISGMQDGERIEVQDLADKVAAKLPDTSHSHVLHLLRIYCKQAKEVVVEPGRMGGIYKGGKKRKTDTRPRCKECHQVLRPVHRISATLH